MRIPQMPHIVASCCKPSISLEVMRSTVVRKHPETFVMGQECSQASFRVIKLSLLKCKAESRVCFSSPSTRFIDVRVELVVGGLFSAWRS